MTERPDTFTRRQVERSFRKFHDLADDLHAAQFQTWGDSFTRLMAHCETDPVMQVITAPLKTDPRVDAARWWTDAVNSVSGMVGSGRYALPVDDDERTALLYQVFLRLEHEDITINDFCVAVYGHTKYQDMVDTFNRELVHKFTREVSYRLNEIAEDVAEQQQIAREAMAVFHHHDYSTNISGIVQGSNIAAGNARLTKSTAQFNSRAGLANELRALKALASDLSTAHQAAVKAALDFLAGAAESERANMSEIIEHAQTIAQTSPLVSSRLRALLDGVGASLVGSAIIEGLRKVFGG